MALVPLCASLPTVPLYSRHQRTDRVDPEVGVGTLYRFVPERSEIRERVFGTR